MDNLTPTNLLFKVQKIKLIKSAIPMLLVFGGLIISMVFEKSQYPMVDYVKYISIIGLVFYFANNTRFKINRIRTKTDANKLYSPVYGKVIENNSKIVVLKHSFFDRSEIRFTDDNSTFEDNCIVSKNAKVEFIGGKVYVLASSGKKAQLCGLLLGNAIVKITLLKNTCDINPGIKLESGIDELFK